MIFSLLALSVVLFLGCFYLGAFVMRHPALSIDAVFNRMCFGRGKSAAAVFTAIGYAPSLSLLSALCAAAAFVLHLSFLRIALLILMQLASQAVCNAFKQHFNRIRPAMWLTFREQTAAYPSGHATTAIVMFGSLAYLILQTSCPDIAKSIFVVISLAIALGIMWSRLALGAHYYTDILGGVMLGSATLCIYIAALPFM